MFRFIACLGVISLICAKADALGAFDVELENGVLKFKYVASGMNDVDSMTKLRVFDLRTVNTVLVDLPPGRSEQIVDTADDREIRKFYTLINGKRCGYFLEFANGLSYIEGVYSPSGQCLWIRSFFEDRSGIKSEAISDGFREIERRYSPFGQLKATFESKRIDGELKTIKYLFLYEDGSVWMQSENDYTGNKIDKYFYEDGSLAIVENTGEDEKPVFYSRSGEIVDVRPELPSPKFFSSD